MTKEMMTMGDRMNPPEHWPPGPALLYITTADPMHLSTEEPSSVFLVDRGVISGSDLSGDEARRERAILRALLKHALYLLGPED